MVTNQKESLDMLDAKIGSDLVTKWGEVCV